MLKKIRIQNYKSLADVILDLQGKTFFAEDLSDGILLIIFHLSLVNQADSPKLLLIENLDHGIHRLWLYVRRQCTNLVFNANFAIYFDFFGQRFRCNIAFRL